MFCRICGNKLEDDAKFCPKCGNSVESDSAKISAKTVQKTENRNDVFQMSSKAPIGYFITIVALVLSATLCFYTRAELYGGSFDPNRNAKERWDLFLWGIVGIGWAIECLLAWWGSTKIKLIVGAHTISGIRMVNIFITKEFEYDYNEVSDVKRSIMGTLSFRVNGKKVSFANLENTEKAKRLIEEKIRK